MTVLINETPTELPDGTRLCDAVTRCSPFGSDPVAVRVNGNREPPDAMIVLCERDALEIYPLLIGG